MKDLVNQRCHNHPAREAAVRCPVCKSYFCRECTTEHEDRLICSVCLKQITTGKNAKGKRLLMPLRVIEVLVGLFLAWLFFYYLGQGLMLIPTSFHEGTMWEKGLDK
jgi:hypothetical protein